MRRPHLAILVSVWVLTGIAPIVTYGQSSPTITSPVVSLTDVALQQIGPVAKDGHRGRGYLRKPPGSERFPAVLILHPGNVELPDAALKDYVSTGPLASRFLAAGYVVAVTTYRSRDLDPQARDAAEDSLAAVDFLRNLDYVDRQSIAVYGCSNGGDLALEVATATEVAAIVAEEPATMMFTGVFNRNSPKAGERYTPLDSRPIMANPSQYYTEAYQKFTRSKIATIYSPILLVQGDETSPGNRWNAEVLLPELRRAGKDFTVGGYAGEPHCFASGSIGDLPLKTPRPAVALQAFQDVAVSSVAHQDAGKANRS
jgi:dipeptidyl aminopeptidase/acylaminoacyl peptidase